MTKLSEAAAGGSQAAKRAQSEAGTVSDVTAPPWLRKKAAKLGDATRKTKG